jgi:hypothetical protein
LPFGDQPTGAYILGQDGKPSPGYDSLPESLKVPKLAPSDSYLGFITELVGVNADFVPDTDCLALKTCVPLAGFSWLSDFNGINTGAFTGSGGIIGPFSNFDWGFSADPGSGTGGVILLGEGTVTVPEPPTIMLLLTGITLVWGLTRKQRRGSAVSAAMDLGSAR